MELTSEQEQQLTLIHEAYWAQYLNGNVEAMEVLLDDSYTQVGSAESEVFTTKKEAVQFLRDTIQEVAGKMQMRNRSTKLESQEAVVLVHERCDLYAQTGTKWVFYSKFRATTFLQEKKDGWKIIHQHSSFPDTKTEKGQNVAIDKIAEENQELRDAIKRRTVELEQKNRELEIEASLERVRSKAMAMQNSDELSELVDTVFKELTKLDLALSWCMINIIDEPTMSNTVWGANPEIGKAPESYHMLFEDYRFHHEMFKAWKEKKDKWVFVLKGAEKEIYDAYLFNQTEFRRVPEPVQKEMRATKQYVASFTFSNFGGLQTVGEEPLSDESLDILSRFGKVFNLTYTRFNDLKQAETQAREAQIETALERVRSRTMAMQKSDELLAAAEILSAELVNLEIPHFMSGFVLVNETTEKQGVHMGVPGQGRQSKFYLPLKGDAILKKRYKSWKNEESIFYQRVEGEKLAAHMAYVTQHFGSEEMVETGRKIPDPVIFYCGNFKEGYLHILSEVYLNEEQESILSRFTKIFQQTYTRFLDLQKAEAQAREAQIEAALERVRTASMTMQKGDELAHVISVVFTQLKILGIDSEGCGLNLYDENDGMDMWMSGFGEDLYPKSFHISYLDHPYYQTQLDAWKEQQNYMVLVFEGKLKRSMDDQTFSNKDFFDLPKDIKEAFLSKEKVISSSAFMKYGMLEMIGDEALSVDQASILYRFAKVFEQAYQRFLDIEKAEVQAREAQIETAMERIRSRAIAMRTSNELLEVALEIRIQTDLLGQQDLELSVVHLYEKDAEYFESLAAMRTPGSEGEITTHKMKFPIDATPEIQQMMKNYWAGLSQYTIELNLKQREAWQKVLETTVPDLFDQRLQFDEDEIAAEKKEYWNFTDFSGGSLLTVTYSPPTTETKELFRRAANVFDLAYKRFKDLQKAEEQAREAQIEAALERIRARALAMHSSEEILDVANVLRKQMGLLGQPELEVSAVHVYTEGAATFESWWAMRPGTSSKGKIITGISQFRINTSALAQEWIEKYQSEQNQYTVYNGGKGLKDWQNEIAFSAPEITAYWGNEPPKEQYCHFNDFSGGSLVMVSTQPPSEESKNLQKRSASVFDLAYRRFRDLQKAEAQAREAQIEAALERVRSKTMAMHNSQEVGATVVTLFDEVMKLGLDKTLRCGIGILEGRDKMETWSANYSASGKVDLKMGKLNMTIHPMLVGLKKAWKSKKAGYAYEYIGEDVTLYYTALNNEPDYPFSADLDTLPEKVFHNSYFFSSGILFAFTENPILKEAARVLNRFANVFGQTYRRYLDLQKAEAQANEAQIEAALERVRASSMAMHKSEDLPETAQVLFEQFSLMGNMPDRISIGIIREDENIIELWATDQIGSQLDHAHSGPLNEATTITKLHKAWKEGKDSVVVDLSGQKLKDWVRYIKEDMKMYIDDSHIKGRRVQQAAFFSKGMLLCTTNEPVSDEIMELLIRFAKVFDQTYTRFLDLQKAEAQAREAQIEAALEKVRGKAMAMHHSNDLVATASVVFSELKNLGINTFRSGVGLATKENKDVELYAATSSDDGIGLSLVGKATLKDHPVLSKIYTSWIKNEDYYPILKGDLLKQYYEQIESQYKVPATHIDSNMQYGCFLPFSEGVFYGWSHEPFTEAEINILHRFNTIMDLTFRRYIELKKAEANALDAIRRSSVDRVRAEIASMRTTGDLERITPIIWNELTALGVPFVRCGVFIFDEQEEQIHTFLSKPDGKAIAAFHLPYNSSPFIDAIENWRSKKIQIIHWDNEGFSELADTLIKEGQIATRQQYLSTVPKDGLYLHYVPFLQGILYVGNTTELDEDSLHLVQSIADAFSTAYARYEDFNKLEEAKKQIEKTLNDLKQTQQQLVQSEKMASLGELTAGIAHEIQNPLNFVNNFSEVSVELIEEMHEELEKGDFKEAMALAEDVKQNLDKITHHGKRADGIVKGMLQHSRSSSGEKEPTDINVLADEYLRLAYHGLRAKDKSFNATIKTDFDENIGKMNIIPQDIGRVVLNLITNAFYAVSERKLEQPEGYEPTVSVSTKKEGDKVFVSVEDNGNGIPKKVLDKIFQPFFTTKPTGQGTGLGLSLSYDIVKAHRGEISVKSKVGEGSTFTIALPA